MNAFFALIPVILIRYILLGLMDKEALKRAAHFPEMIGSEKVAYWFYQASTILLFIYSMFLTISFDGLCAYSGLALYGLGMIVLILSTCDFVHTENGLTTKGIYRISRNPMYIGYFLGFLGCVLMARSIALLVILIVFQVSAHWIILAEERWCVQRFGEDYIQYMRTVRRYL